MLKELIPIEEVLFVFGSWTLMIKFSLSSPLKSGEEVYLLNLSKNRIGRAKLNKFLPSKNQDISPIEIELIETPHNLKDVKFISQK